jgi:hypothetical protein
MSIGESGEENTSREYGDGIDYQMISGFHG